MDNKAQIVELKKFLNDFEISVNFKPSGSVKIEVGDSNETIALFSISLDNFVPYNDLRVLANDIIKVSEKILPKIKRNVRYIFNTSLKKEELLNFYEDIIADRISVRRDIAILKNLKPTPTDDGHIKLYVAEDLENKVYEKEKNFVNKVFSMFGLTDVVEINSSNFVSSIAESINISKKKEFEKPIPEEKRFTDISKDQDKKTIKQPKKRQIDQLARPSVPLKELPTSEADFQRFEQTKGPKFTIVVEGKIIQSEIVEIPKFNSKIFKGVLFDGEDSLRVSKWLREDGSDYEYFKTSCKEGTSLKVVGYLEYDRYSSDINLRIYESQIIPTDSKNTNNFVDNEPFKRVELRAHSKMTDLDSVLDYKEYVKMAADAGYQALAITDKENVHIFPEFYFECRRNRIKPILGLDAYYIDDEKIRITRNSYDAPLDDLTYTVFDIETTGFSAKYDTIIEIGAVKFSHGNVIDKFSEFINPHQILRDKIKELTNITQEEVDNADDIKPVLKRFKAFIEGTVLVAHNAEFDLSFIYQKLTELKMFTKELPSIDTLRLAHFILPNQKKFGLEDLCKTYGVELEGHHRAINDAVATEEMFRGLLRDLKTSKKVSNLKDINSLITKERILEIERHPYSLTLLVKNEIGKRNLYKIVTDSNLYFREKRSYVFKSEINKHREGILVGSGASDSELMNNLFNGYEGDFKELYDFCDYLEVLPLEGYKAFYREYTEEENYKYAKDVIKRLISYNQKANENLKDEEKKLVVAVGNLYHLRRSDREIRKIFLNTKRVGGGVHPLYNVDNFPSEHFRNTGEMLKEFSFLEEDVRNEIVIRNTQKIASLIQEFDLFPKELLAPRDNFLEDRGVPSFNEGIKKKSYDRLHEIYGDRVPKLIGDRLEKELNSIISNHYSSIYYISHLLVDKCIKDGSVVGSRGSVGSSYVAYLLGITEVNPLPPHYVCPRCHFSYMEGDNTNRELEENFTSAFTGPDLPVALCPSCKTVLDGIGVNIPFETFLGFEGDKVPDIDLNFSGQYQPIAHEFCQTIFGKDHSFRSGTINAVAQKTAYGYVKNYLESHNINLRRAEIDRIAKVLEGSKKTTGQHPGGIVVIRKDEDILKILPLQYPAGKAEEGITTHFSYDQFKDNLLKFDVLGHDDPTMIKFFADYIKAHPKEFTFKSFEDIPLNDPKVLELFSSLDSLGLKPEDLEEEVGTTALPEFGTPFVKKMLSEIHPRTFADLLKVSGLSHGTDVWLNNARDLLLGISKKFSNEKIPFQELIGCRDDIMDYLIRKKLEKLEAFNIMESVRKGKGLTTSYETILRKHNVSEWYIDSCKKIKYMFPKAHACAYVIMALRIGWFKIYKPLLFYQAYLSIRAKDFDYNKMLLDPISLKASIKELEDSVKRTKDNKFSRQDSTGKTSDDQKKTTKKEEDIIDTLRVVLEMKYRGYNIKGVDLQKSLANDFYMEEETGSLIMPFVTIAKLGPSTAEGIVKLRETRGITSIDSLKTEARVNSTMIKTFKEMGLLEGLKDTEQLGLFDLEVNNE